jgi:hypothetical protein
MRPNLIETILDILESRLNSEFSLGVDDLDYLSWSQTHMSRVVFVDDGHRLYPSPN